MRVLIPTPLRSYTQRAEVEANGATVSEVLTELMRFRLIDEQGQIRPRMRVFVNGEQARSIDQPTSADDEIHILQAPSGG